MPSGYTQALYDSDQSFRDFALGCARAFIIDMRDAPADAEIPQKWEPSSYNSKQLEEARSRLHHARLASETAMETLAAAEFERVSLDVAEARRKASELTARYEKMLEQVRAWEPPTPKHEKIKEFMEEQLTESLRYDGSTTYLKDPERRTAEEHRQKLIKKATADIDYHTQRMAEEKVRAENNTKWVQDLYASLPANPGTE